MSKGAWNRRSFLRSAALGALGGYAALKGGRAFAGPGGGGGMGGGGGGMGGGGGGMGGGGGGGGCHGGGGVIDPPVGPAFANPPELAPSAREVIDGRTVVTFDLVAQNATIPVGGVAANLLTYNGLFPGPTIRVRHNDRVRINLTNQLVYPGTNLIGHVRDRTNLHTHGWHVSPMEPADYVMYDLRPGETYHHEYDLMTQRAGSFNFYHPHRHGNSAEQYWAGLVGALITEDELPVFTTAPLFSTKIMVLKDLALSGSNPAPHSMMHDYMHGLSGPNVMVNGQINPLLEIQQGEVQRWQILNASNVRHYVLQLEGHSLHVVGTDGHHLDRPYARSQILLAPGERVEVLVQASSTRADYRLLSMPVTWSGMGGSDRVTLLTMRVARRSSTSLRTSIPAAIDPTAARVDPRSVMIAAERTMALGMGMGNAYINGMDFDVDPYTIMSELGSYEVWTITNGMGMYHPFHQHVMPALVLAVTGADAAYPPYQSWPAWKDTVLIPKHGSVTLLVPVVDYEGMAMFHCHILEHEDIGMMGMWHIMGGPMMMG